MQFNKTPATIKQQIEILRQRGCIIDDEEYARTVSYTHLTLPTKA